MIFYINGGDFTDNKQQENILLQTLVKTFQFLPHFEKKSGHIS